MKVALVESFEEGEAVYLLVPVERVGERYQPVGHHWYQSLCGPVHEATAAERTEALETLAMLDHRMAEEAAQAFRDCQVAAAQGKGMLVGLVEDDDANGAEAYYLLPVDDEFDGVHPVGTHWWRPLCGPVHEATTAAQRTRALRDLAALDQQMAAEAARVFRNYQQQAVDEEAIR